MPASPLLAPGCRMLQAIHARVRELVDSAGAAGVAGIPVTVMIFFTPEQLETMHEQELNDSQTTRVAIWNEMKAAAGA